MKNQKTLFLLPGFGMNTKSKYFAWLVEYLENKKIRVIKVPVKWSFRTLSQNTADFITFYNKNKGKENYILGFSYGAVIILASANITRPKKIFLCSLSAAFAEDQHSERKYIKYIGKKRFADMKNRNGKKLAKNLQIPSVIFCGEKEGEEFPPLKKRCEETAKLAKKSRLIRIKDGPHDIRFPKYAAAIKKELSKL